MKVAVLTHRSAAAEYFCRSIAAKHELAGVFIEEGAGSRVRKALNQFKRNRKKFGLFTAVVRFCELPFVIWLESSYKKRAQRFFAGLIPPPTTRWKEHRIASVNDEAAVAALAAQRPDAVCVFGTGILRAPVIRVPRLGVLNMHTSLLPSYRGAKSELWALSNSETDKIGVTVHLIDEGVDTGPILAQTATLVDPGDDDRSLRCKNILAGTRLVLESLDRLEQGTAAPVRQEGTKSASYSTPTLRAFFRMRRNLRSLRS